MNLRIKRVNLKTVKKAASIAGIVLMALMLGLVIYICVCNFLGKPAKLFGYTVAKVMTSSMSPMIKEGDCIIIKTVDTDTLEVGDVITFYSDDSEIEGMLNTHRIIEILENGDFVTKGDANQYADSVTVDPKSVVGEYVGKSRFLHWINSFGSTRKLLMLLVILPILGVSVYEVVTIRRIRREIKSESDEEAAARHEQEIREAIEKEKQRLYAEFNAKQKEKTEGESALSEVASDGTEEAKDIESRKDNED